MRIILNLRTIGIYNIQRFVIIIRDRSSSGIYKPVFILLFCILSISNRIFDFFFWMNRIVLIYFIGLNLLWFILIRIRIWVLFILLNNRCLGIGIALLIRLILLNLFFYTHFFLNFLVLLRFLNIVILRGILFVLILIASSFIRIAFFSNFILILRAICCLVIYYLIFIILNLCIIWSLIIYWFTLIIYFVTLIIFWFFLII